MDGTAIQFQISNGRVYVLDSTGAMWCQKLPDGQVPAGEWYRMPLPGAGVGKPKTAYEALLAEQERLRVNRSDEDGMVDQEP